MMRFPLKVTYAGGREQSVIVGPPDLLAFERAYNLPTSAIASGRNEYLWFACWNAIKRTTGDATEFETWVGSLESVEDDETEAASIVPLEPSPPTGS